MTEAFSLLWADAGLNMKFDALNFGKGSLKKKKSLNKHKNEAIEMYWIQQVILFTTFVAQKHFYNVVAYSPPK